MQHGKEWLTLAWTPALTVVLLWWTRRFAPAAMVAHAELQRRGFSINPY